MVDRFKIILEQLHLTPSEFADQIGIQRSSMSHVLSGRNKPGIEFLEKILNTFPEIDAAWLITGKAPKDALVKKTETKTSGDISQQKADQGFDVKTNNPPPPADEGAVDHIILVYRNNTFRILHHPGG